jgi:hypothetical protein
MDTTYQIRERKARRSQEELGANLLHVKCTNLTLEELIEKVTLDGVPANTSHPTSLKREF